MDLSMWHDRLALTVDAYSATTSDLLLRRAISSVSGVTSMLQNIGKTANKGFEVGLNTLNIDHGPWQWRTEFNVSVNRNRIVDLYGDGKDDVANSWFIGQPIQVNYGYQFAGIWQVGESTVGTAQPTAKPGDVKVADLNGDGQITPADRTILGSIQPKYTGGFTNTVRYGALNLSLFFNTVQGVTRDNTLLSTNQVLSDVRRNMEMVQWWTPENPINSYPANSLTSNPFALPFYEDASFIRLKDATLSYDLPARLVERLGSSSARIYVNGRNLWTKTAWTGLDPELVGTSNDQRTVPLERVITGGLTLRF
jgi:hypothetical protein